MAYESPLKQIVNYGLTVKAKHELLTSARDEWYLFKDTTPKFFLAGIVFLDISTENNNEKRTESSIMLVFAPTADLPFYWHINSDKTPARAFGHTYNVVAGNSSFGQLTKVHTI